jgi:hypothetical protein
MHKCCPNTTKDELTSGLSKKAGHDAISLFKLIAFFTKVKPKHVGKAKVGIKVNKQRWEFQVSAYQNSKR